MYLTRMAWFRALVNALVCVSLLATSGAASDVDDFEKAAELVKRQSSGTKYLLGVGKADITGPVVEISFMGYADLSQIGTGLRQRLYARTFIIGDVDNENDRFAYINLDTQSGDTGVRYGILNGLAGLGSDYSMYNQSNIAVVGTHSHNGPGAWLNYLLPTITTGGVDPQSFNAIVDGAVLSFQRAHESLTEGTLSYGSTRLDGATISRSAWAYEQNPASERAAYTDDVDKTMTLLKFTRSSDGKAIGALNWFAIHGTSMMGNNTLASGDNKGVAADMLEKYVAGSVTATDDFVAGFSQSSVGDTTPRTLGAYCNDGSMCSYERSLCGDSAATCYGRGPNFTILDYGATSCYTIGNLQYEAAKGLLESEDLTPVVGDAVRSYHTFQDMRYFTFTLPNGSVAQTCPAALGYGFAAGTTDWPGAFDFKQGTNTSTDRDSLWELVRDFLHTPNATQEACQSPKPILLDVGEQTVPYDWAPSISDIQSFRVGQMFVIVSPGEATTMTGRRWRNTVSDYVTSHNLTGGVDPVVVLGAPANSYTHYIATPEEYSVQRYEGASTLFGPHTLDAYLNLTLTYLPYLADERPSEPLAPGPSPPNLIGGALNINAGVVYDNPYNGSSFGDVVSDVPATATKGDVINCTFVGANPRNSLRLEQNYATVEKQSSDGSWDTVRDDSSWDLVFHWKRKDSVLGTSTVTLEWKTGEVSTPLPAGTYRLRYFGESKAPISGKISSFDGASGPIQIS